MPQPDAVVHMRGVGQRNDPRPAHLLVEHDVARALEDLQIAVVAGPQPRRAPRDAPLAEAAVFRPPGVALPRRRPRPRPRPRRLGAGRQPPVGRIDDQRGPVVPVALDHPEVIVVAGRPVARRERLGLGQRRREDAVAEGGVVRLGVEQFAGARLQRRHLLVGQGLAPAEHLGPLERRHVVVGPDPLQVGVAVGRPGRRPLLPRRERRRREHRHDEKQRFQSHGTLLIIPNANAAGRARSSRIPFRSEYHRSPAVSRVLRPVVNRRPKAPNPHRSSTTTCGDRSRASSPPRTALPARSGRRPAAPGPSDRRVGDPRPSDARYRPVSSHSTMRGVTNSGASLWGPCPTPGRTWIVSGPSTRLQIPFRVSFRNGPLFLP